MRKLKLLKLTTLVLTLIFSLTQLFAQNRTVTGTVTDQTGRGVSGVTVTVKGTTTATQTDAAGFYRISAPENGTLVFSSVGYTNMEISIGGKTSVDASMASSNDNLSEVIVQIGYGSARKRDVTGAISSLKSKDFNQGIITSPDQLLQSKVAGLEVTDNSGQPGAATTVKIRGNNSIRTGNNPLYVIDGVPLDGRNARPGISLGLGFNSTPDANPLLYINPNDIAQVDVLKDASATAIYGSRGANGVIVITTKKGLSGATRLEFNTSFGFAAGYMKKFDVLNASQFRSAIKKYSLPTTLDGGANVDPLKAITQNTLSQHYGLAFSGGNETGKFRASFYGARDEGFIKNSSLDRYLGSLSGQYKFLDKKLSIDFSLIAGHTTENIVLVTNNAGSQGNLISSALSWNPTIAFTDNTGAYNYPTNGSGNPLALLAASSDKALVNSALANISASYKLLPNLEYKYLIAINQSNGTRYTNLDGFVKGYTGLSGVGFGAISGASLTSLTIDHTLSYNANITSDLKFEALAGYEYWRSDYSNSSISASGFNTNMDQFNLISVPYTSILRDGKTQNPAGTYVDPRTELQSYFARVNFNYFDRYYLTGTFRADGSSKFGANNKYGYFPSVGAKWIISNEAFMKGSTSVSSLALRGSWGITGNQEFPAGASQEQFGFGAYNTAGQQNVANPNLKWESTRSYNIGADFSIMRGRIYASVDYYNKNTTNILFQSTAIQPAPASIYYINIPGNLMNSGVEVSIGATIIDRKDLEWDLNGNFSYNKNILKNFYAAGTTTPLSILTGTIDGQGVSGTLSQIITNNQPVNEFYVKTFGGFDASGNQIIGANPTYAGDPNPHTLFGVSTNLRVKKFIFSLNGGGAGGYMIYNNTATNITNIAGIVGGRNIDLAAYNSKEGVGSGVGASSRFLESGNYFKLRNATLRYNVGTIGKYISNFSVFVSGTNLFVITKFSGFDPEVNIDKNSGGYPSRSIEYVPYPTPRIISFGLNFSL